jgi:hypothetical protein
MAACIVNDVKVHVGSPELAAELRAVSAVFVGKIWRGESLLCGQTSCRSEDVALSASHNHPPEGPCVAPWDPTGGVGLNSASSLDSC